MSVVHIGIIALIGLAMVILLLRTRVRPIDAPRCGGCGYNLTGCTENRCPECGGRFIDVGVNVPRPGRDPRRRILLLAGIGATVLALVLGIAATWYFAMLAQRERAAAMAAQAQARAAAQQMAAVNRFQSQMLQEAASQVPTADEVRRAIDEALRRPSAATQPATGSADEP